RNLARRPRAALQLSRAYPPFFPLHPVWADVRFVLSIPRKMHRHCLTKEASLVEPARSFLPELLASFSQVIQRIATPIQARRSARPAENSYVETHQSDYARRNGQWQSAWTKATRLAEMGAG